MTSILLKLCLCIVAIIVPPLPVALVDGFKFHFWFNLAVWSLGLCIGTCCGLPFPFIGIVHAWFVIILSNLQLSGD